ncbi:MAG: 50S ribosomal protein L4 [bacterium]|nr:50S ribosomal protein L4 [bacterium]
MPSVDVLSIQGQKSGTVDLPAALFEARVSTAVVHTAVVAYETNQRQGNASVLSRSETSYSSKKHHRQKGTGGARRGTVSSPLLRGGGVAFGLPKPRSYRTKLPRTLRKQALRSVLTAMGQEGQVFVVDGFQLAAPKTKDFVAMLTACGLAGRKVLFVTAENSPILVKSGRNIPKVSIRTAETVGTYDLVAADVLLLERAAVDALNRVHGDHDGE